MFNIVHAEERFQLLVGFGTAVDPQTVLDEYGGNFHVQLTVNRPLGSGYIVDIRGELSFNQREELIELLNSDPRIRYAEQPPRLRAKFTPNELATSGQWYLTDSYGVDAPDAWSVTRGDNTVVIALLDTGILTHADLDASRVLPGYDFISDATYSSDGNGRDADPSDPGDAVVADECGIGEPAADSSWHGLQVAGVVAATADNAIGIAGVDHRARLLPVRVLGKCGGDFIDVLEALRWAAGLSVPGVADNSNPADVINMSFSGTGQCTQPIQDIISEVLSQGVVIVAAAGNENADVSQRVPANCKGVIAVAASDRAGDRASYSNNGELIDITAPGGGGTEVIHTLSNTGTTDAMADTFVGVMGTSFSAAMTTGGIALLRAENDSLAPADILFYLQSEAQSFPAGSTCDTSTCGAGLLNLANSLQAVAADASTPVASNSSSNTASTANTSGGGGGGCVLGRDARTADISWLLVAVWVAAVAFRQHLLRIRNYVL